MGRAIVSLQADAAWKGEFCPRRMASEVWGMTQHVVATLQHSLQRHQMVLVHFPHVVLVCFVLPPPEPRVSGCEKDFVCWPFKRIPSSQPSLPGRQKPCCFSQPDIIWVPFPGMVLWVGEPCLGFRPHTSWGSTSPPPAEIPSGT